MLRTVTTAVFTQTVAIWLDHFSAYVNLTTLETASAALVTVLLTLSRPPFLFFGGFIFYLFFYSFIYLFIYLFIYFLVFYPPPHPIRNFEN